ncbi:ubiquitin-like [Trichogramma pretiosum]|uniref:ubiquitin-like n=1 Tax=Trichogramma pretiosum TaxID=7493 RepID=UPI0006C9CB4F|nr:ubiquitin-like [Trichogramma pretiosum]
MRVIVKTLTGKEIKVDIESSETVEELKEYVEGKEGVPVNQQRFVFNREQLENEKTLQDYNIEDGSIVHMVLRLGGPCTTCIMNVAHNFAKDLLKVDGNNVETTQLKSMAERALSVAQSLEQLHKVRENGDKIKIKRQLKCQSKEEQQSK